MWIKLLLILPVTSYVAPYGYYFDNDINFLLRDVNCGTNRGSVHIALEKKLNFKELTKYETELKVYKNVTFNEIKYYPILWDEIKDHHRARYDLCGVMLYPHPDISYNYHISYSVGYYKGNNFDDIKYFKIFCNLQQCDLGLVLFDKKYNAEVLNKKEQIHQVEHAVLMVIKSSDNKMLLGTIKYNDTGIRLSVCPYFSWVPKEGLIKFIPEDNIKGNGYTEIKNGYGHITVPFYKKDYESEIFICGKLKQPTVPDLVIGFKLESDNNSTTLGETINPLEDDLKCEKSDDLSHLYHFGYSEKETNYMSDRRMDLIEVRNINSSYKFYAGQYIYIYPWDKIEKSLANKHDHLRLENTHVEEYPKCIRPFIRNISATILPTIGSIDSIQYNPNEKIFYRLIKYEDLEKKYEFRCLSKFEGKYKLHMDEFYSRTAEFSIKNEEKPDIIYTLTKNEIVFNAGKIDNYGSYRCVESNPIKLFDKEIISLEKIYYLPNNGFELSFDKTFLKNKDQQLIGCTRIYESLGNLKKMTIDFGENNKKPVDFDNFSNSTDKIDVKENIIAYKIPKDIFGLTIKCTYETPAKTTFLTKHNFHTYNINGNEGGKKNVTEVKEKVITQVKDNSKPWVIGIVFIVIIFCITVIVVAFLIVRKIKKKRNANSLSSHSIGSSSYPGISKKGSRNMSNSKSRTKNKSNISKSKVSNNRQRSKTGNYSSNVSKNSSSTNRGRKFYKNVKLAAK